MKSKLKLRCPRCNSDNVYVWDSMDDSPLMCKVKDCGHCFCIGTAILSEDDDIAIISDGLSNIKDVLNNIEDVYSYYGENALTELRSDILKEITELESKL